MVKVRGRGQRTRSPKLTATSANRRLSLSGPKDAIVISDSEASAEHYKISSSPLSKSTDSKSIMVRIPTRQDLREKSSPESISTSGTNDGDKSALYDTPGTSAVPTPAETSLVSVTSSRTRRPRISAAARAAELRESEFSLASAQNGTKRKRSMKDESSIVAGDFDFLNNKTDNSPKLPERSAQRTTRKRSRLSSNVDDDETDLSGHSNRKLYQKQLAEQKDYELAVALEQEDLQFIDSDSDSDAYFAPQKSSSRRANAMGPGRRSSAKDVKREIAPKPVKKEEKNIAPKAVEQKTDLTTLKDYLSDSSSLSDFPFDEYSLNSDSDSLADFEAEEAEEESGTAGGRNGYTRAKWNTAKIETKAMRGFRTRHLNRAEKERVKLEEKHPEILTMWDDLKAQTKPKEAMAEQPKTIKQTLKPFQLVGLQWMIDQEKTKWKGGLLADEMGMGKTIQAVSLIMSDFPAKNPTLVLVPPVALMQWQNEILDYTDGKLKVLVFHGSNNKAKNLSQKELKKYDVIILSYAGLESRYRKEIKGWNRKDSDGETAIVKEDSVMHAIHWHRVILDEAHNIKSRTTGVAKACFALKSDFRWCLSGTPLQNRIGELFSLLRFLNVVPFACYMCKECDCKTLHWSIDNASKKCSCGHGGLRHVSVFNQELLDPISKFGSRGLGKVAFQKLKLLTDALMLRRLKCDNTKAMELPPKEVQIDNQFFGAAELDFANSIMSATARTFDTYVTRGVMLNNYANIFGLIMQMRQVADHPDLITKRNVEGGQNVLVCAICNEPAEEPIRSSCRHDFCRGCAKTYVATFSESNRSADCPRCHIALSIDLEQPELEQEEAAVKKSSIINRIRMENWTSSTKIESLISNLAELRVTGMRKKSIIFSQFTSMLQLIEWRLHNAGFQSVMLDGTMSPIQRQSSINFFMENPRVEVFLVSLKAGGVALNLVEASRVFIVDPWWNPAAEWQSADRCHRIGQRRPCEITRLCIEDSVESRIVQLQEKKANMIRSTINDDEAAMQNLTPEDMQFLFRGS